MTHLHTTIEVDDLAVTYRRLGRAPVEALRGVSLRANAGEVLGVLGRNGSGKSTLFAVLAGNLAPTRGRARVLGQDPLARSLIAKLGYQPEGPLPLRDLTPRAFLREFATLLGMPRAAAHARCDELLGTVGLAEVARRRRVDTLSTGMARRLGLAAALLSDPEILLLDEPTAGLDPEGSLLVLDLLRALAARGRTVLLASHHLQELEALCTRVVMLHDGKVAAQGTLDELLGTDATELTVAGLAQNALADLVREITARGGTVLTQARRREHLFALFRRLQDGGAQRG